MLFGWVYVHLLLLRAAARSLVINCLQAACFAVWSYSFAISSGRHRCEFSFVAEARVCALSTRLHSTVTLQNSHNRISASAGNLLFGFLFTLHTMLLNFVSVPFPILYPSLLSQFQYIFMHDLITFLHTGHGSPFANIPSPHDIQHMKWLQSLSTQFITSLIQIVHSRLLSFSAS